MTLLAYPDELPLRINVDIPQPFPRILEDLARALAQQQRLLFPQDRKPAQQARQSVPDLLSLLRDAQRENDHATWTRAKAVLSHIQGEPTGQIAAALEVSRRSVSRWVRHWEAEGVDGLTTGKPSGAKSRLSEHQCEDLAFWIELGPQALCDEVWP